MSGELVLVTGGSGSISTRCILQLLDAGYRVRTTVRSLRREADVRVMLKAGGAEPGPALSFAAADLMSDAGWPEAVAGCVFVLHVASPFPVGVPKNKEELIIPAREGALRVLRAAREAGVKRVEQTSSFAEIVLAKYPTCRRMAHCVSRRRSRKHFALVRRGCASTCTLAPGTPPRQPCGKIVWSGLLFTVSPARQTQAAGPGGWETK